jgi:hypothetical protein
MPYIGEFNFLGAYQEPTESVSETGVRSYSYATVLSAWGKLRRSRGSRTSVAELQVNSSWIWECHFQSDLSIGIKNRWVIDGKTFTVDDYETIDQKRQFYRFKLLAVE